MPLCRAIEIVAGFLLPTGGNVNDVGRRRGLFCSIVPGHIEQIQERAPPAERHANTTHAGFLVHVHRIDRHDARMVEPPQGDRFVGSAMGDLQYDLATAQSQMLAKIRTSQAPRPSSSRIKNFSKKTSPAWGHTTELMPLKTSEFSSR